MALASPIDESRDEIRAVLEPIRHRFSIALYKCENAFAVGAIIRVAHSFLTREIVLVGPETHYEKASMGMEKYENLVCVPDTEALLRHTARRPLFCIEREYAAASVTSVSSFPEDVVFVFGSERRGIPRELIDRSDCVLAIPMYGINNSFPVTVAAGIVMHEWARRKYATAVSM